MATDRLKRRALYAQKRTAKTAGEIAGGLLDVQSDPTSVYLYRREPRELAEKLGIDCSHFEGPTVPVVYNVSFKDPGGYFLATKVQMYNKDVIFASNASSLKKNRPSDCSRPRILRA